MVEVKYLNSNTSVSRMKTSVYDIVKNDYNASNSSSYKLVVSCKIDNKIKRFEFDTVDSWPINRSTVVTTQPMINGDIVADHIYREPSSIAVSGSFSLNGSKSRSTYTGGVDRLSDIQSIFERISDEGIKCTLTFMTPSIGGGVSTRFLIRENYVITNIRWDPKLTSMNFTMTFTEVIFGNAIEDSPSVIKDKYPSVTGVSESSLVDTYLNKTIISTYCISVMKLEGYTDDEFLRCVIEDAENLLAGSDDKQEILNILNIAINNGVNDQTKGEVGEIAMWGAVGLTASAGLTIAFLPAGVISILACLTVTSIMMLFRANKLKIDKFFYTKKRNQMIEREKKFIEWIRSSTNYVSELEPEIDLYFVSSEGLSNKSNVDIVLPIGEGYYQINFNLGNDDEKFMVSLQDLDNNLVGESKTVSEEVSSIFNLNRSSLYGIINERSVYVFNYKLAACKNENERKETLKDISSYAIVVSTKDMEQFQEGFIELIKSHLYK